jgi:hypothetical protein
MRGAACEDEQPVAIANSTRVDGKGAAPSRTAGNSSKLHASVDGSGAAPPGRAGGGGRKIRICINGKVLREREIGRSRCRASASVARCCARERLGGRGRGLHRRRGAVREGGGQRFSVMRSRMAWNREREVGRRLNTIWYWTEFPIPIP